MDFRCFHNLFHMNSAKETDNGLNISGGSDEEAWSCVGVETWKNDVHHVIKLIIFFQKSKAGSMFTTM